MWSLSRKGDYVRWSGFGKDMIEDIKWQNPKGLLFRCTILFRLDYSWSLEALRFSCVYGGQRANRVYLLATPHCYPSIRVNGPHTHIAHTQKKKGSSQRGNTTQFRWRAKVSQIAENFTVTDIDFRIIRAKIRWQQSPAFYHLLPQCVRATHLQILSNAWLAKLPFSEEDSCSISCFSSTPLAGINRAIKQKMDQQNGKIYMSSLVRAWCGVCFICSG